MQTLSHRSPSPPPPTYRNSEFALSTLLSRSVHTWNVGKPWVRGQGCGNQSGFFHITGKALERVSVQELQEGRDKTSWEGTNSAYHHRHRR